MFGTIPQGKTECRAEDEPRGNLYVRWAPGDGFVRELMISRVPKGVDEWTGGKFFVSLSYAGRWVGQCFGHLDFFHANTVAEHFAIENESDLMACTAMLNWVCDGKESREYADECWHRFNDARR